MKNIVFVILLAFAGVSFGQTVFSGIITENTWWTASNSPYILTNDVVIAPDARLVIEPGVTVLVERPTRIPEGIQQIDQLDSFTVSIKVYGAIYALGTPTNPIIFRGQDVKTENINTHWFGIFINSRRTQEITIGYAIISSAANGIWVKNGRPMIRNTLFEFNNTGLRIENRADVRAIHNIFSKNFLAGVRVLESNPFIFNSIFVDNNTIGLWGDGKAKIDLRNNLFFNNGRNFSNTDPLFGIKSRVNANGDSTDFAGNMIADPIFVGSVREASMRAAGRPERIPASQIIMNEINDNRRLYFLSPFSPAIDAGVSDRMFREPDGSLPDLGIWGGAEIIRF